jgi:3-dehydroquinate synthase
LDTSPEPLKQRFTQTIAYEVHFTHGLFRPDNDTLVTVLGAEEGVGPRKVLVVVDDGLVARHPDLVDRIVDYAASHSERFVLACAPRRIPGGEQCKNDPALPEAIQRDISDFGLCRHSCVLGVGGGAVLDMVGYAAATAHRGLRLVRVPTTVLSQNDSGVGVKNGINAFGKKNFLGTFAPPHAVLNDFSFLTTLDDRDWRSGIAEAVKVALIKDREFFEWIESRASALARRDMPAMRNLIHRCARLHADHIAGSGDPFERGSSRPLDFGHWSAHKLEQLTDFRLRHGEAVAIGIALDTVYSALAGLLDASGQERILRTLEALGFELFVPELGEHLEDASHPRSVFGGLEEFREHLGGRLTVMLLAGIGRGVEVNEVDLNRYRRAIDLLADTDNRVHHDEHSREIA